MNLEKKLHDYISRELLNGTLELGVEDNLLSEGMVDSIGMTRLVGFIEEELGISVPPEDFTIDHFETIAIISKYLKQQSELVKD